MTEQAVSSVPHRSPPGAGPRPARRAWAAGWALLAAAALAAGWSGWRYASSGPSAAASERDAVTAAATAEIAGLNTVDDKRIATWQARWLADTTGAEHSQVAATNGAAMAQIKRVKTSSAGTVTAIAVTSLRSGTATVIATVRVNQTADSGAADTVENRYLATLTLTSSGWKVSSLSHA
jgi:Mce-associated membrane protein